MGKIVLIIACVVGVSSMASAGEVYRWVDKNGKVQYGDQSVPGSEPVTIHSAPPTDASYTERLNQQKKLSEATAKEKEQQTKSKTEQTARTKEMETKCQEVKEQLKILDLNRPVYITDDKGERAYLSDADRAAKLEEFNSLAQKLCK